MKDMALLKCFLMPGDIVNTRRFSSKETGIKKLEVLGAIAVINLDQMGVFGIRSDWHDHHTMMYFDDNHTFSVQPPVPKWLSLSDYCEEEVSIFRWNLVRPLRSYDVSLLYEGAEKIIRDGKGYDIGQLVDFLISSIAGYPFDDTIKWFDQGKGRMVCSVGTAFVTAYFRHKLFELTGEDLPQPFKTLNPKAWSKKFQERFNKEGHWDINRTFPACYANCLTHFQNDYKLVASFDKNGKRTG